MNPITFDSENFMDVLRQELETRRQRRIQKRWELAATIGLAVAAAVLLIAWRVL